MEFIDIKKQYQLYKSTIDQAIHEVLDQGTFIMGPQVKELETKLAAYVGVKHCITVSSGTDSLLIALMALGVQPGDEVITTPFSWISTAEVIGLAGATPVFVDIDPKTYNLDVDQLEKAITPRTKVIMPVSLFGQMLDYDAVNQFGIPVIEDGAQSFGASRNGKLSCGVTLVGSTSFFPAKPFGCYGDGGALFTHDDKLAGAMRAIRNHGGEVRHHHTCLGLNGRLDTIQAAILLAKLPFFPDEVLRRQQIGARYSEKLKESCIIPEVAERNTHVYAQYTVRVPNRDLLAENLKKVGIPTAIYYPKCIHLQPVFSYLNLDKGSFPESEKASQEVISLPMHPWLTEEEQDFIISNVNKNVMAYV